MSTHTKAPGTPSRPPSLGVVAREWTRIGCIGFGGPPAHLALLRQLCVERRGWLSPEEFEDAMPALSGVDLVLSTQGQRPEAVADRIRSALPAQLVAPASSRR